MTLFLGVDGGSSKTAGVIVDGEGKRLAWAKAAGSVIEGRPPAKSLAVLRILLGRLCRQAGIRKSSLAASAFCLSGADYADEMPMQRRMLSAALGLPLKSTRLANDAVGALWGCGPGKAAVVVQFGTAFTAAWRRGWGTEELFDNLAVGRPFDIRFELPALVVRMIDGRVKPTPLKRLALRHYGVTAAELPRALFQKRVPASKFYSTPPLVFAAWKRGDRAAARLVESAAGDCALAARTMLAKAGPGAKAYFGGGVISRGSQAFLGLISKKLGGPALKPALPPEYGAAVMAAHAAGMPPEGIFRKVHAHL